MLGYVLYDFHFHHSEKKSAEARKVFGNLFTEKDAARVPLTIFVSFHVFRVEKYVFLSGKFSHFMVLRRYGVTGQVKEEKQLYLFFYFCVLL